MPKNFKPMTSRGQKLFRKLLDPDATKRLKLTEVPKYLEDKWLRTRSVVWTVLLIKRNLALLARHGLVGSLVVSILTFYSDDPSSNPAGNYIYLKRQKNK